MPALAADLQRRLDLRLSPMARSILISRLRDEIEIHPERERDNLARIAQLEDTMTERTTPAAATIDYRGDQKRHDDLRATVEIVAAIGGNIPDIKRAQEFIAGIYETVAGLGRTDTAPAKAAKQEPAVPIKKSVTPDFIICLEDGLKFKSLKRHLRTKYNMSPDEYRAKWGLPADYPLASPNYSARRSELAKNHGLGKKG